MNIFNVIYSYFYQLFVEIFYHLDRKVDKKERVYRNRKKNKHIIVVDDKEIGKRLYEIVKFLHLMKFDVTYATIQFSKYGLVRKNTIKWIQIEGVSYISQDEKLYVLRATQRFVDLLQNHNWVLDNTVFDNPGASNISEFLSFFINSSENAQIEKSKGCMIEYIHYVLSNGGNLKEFYEDFNDKVFVEGNKLPCNSPNIIKMCYNYFKTKATPDSIYEILEQRLFNEISPTNLVTIRENLDSKFTVTEKTSEYTVYGGCYKIYENISSEFRTFLYNYGVQLSKEASFEEIEHLIVDLDNQIIGYKVAESNMVIDSFNNIVNQERIFEYVTAMVKYLEKYNRASMQNSKSNGFEIEKCIVCNCYYKRFRCKTVKDLFELWTKNNQVLKEQVAEVFFKLLAKYIAGKYGELTSKEQFLEKIEIRYLTPLVVREFVNFALGKKVDYHVAAYELYKLLFNHRAISANGCFSYDERICYNPLTAPITFDYEIKSKYNAKLEKGKKEKLPDGSTVVIFSRSCNISEFMQREQKRRNELSRRFDIEDEHVKLAGFSEIILGTQRLNNDNMYNVIGYVTESLKGERITSEKLVQLNNRDLLKVAGYLFSKFNNYYIHWNDIWMDNDFNFYINYLDEKFVLIKQTETECFVEWMFRKLLEAGYNPNAFVQYVWNSGVNGVKIKQYLLHLASRMVLYCDEHQIYYHAIDGLCPVCAKTKFFLTKDFDRVLIKVFEDSVAIHYNITKMYNLKIYKSDYKEKLQENVVRLVNLRAANNDTTQMFFQDCFLPIQMAFDSNKQFVGYVYEAERFEIPNQDTSGVCVDLASKENLLNLPRLKSLIRLCLQVKEITNRNLGFIMDPFSHVFLNTSHKKQVQILNIEFIKPCNEQEIVRTQQLACEYIYRILHADRTIRYYRDPFIPENLDTILSKLKGLAEKMTKYCSIHKMYYNGEHICCPKCVDPSKQVKGIRYASKSYYDTRNPSNEGGEAFIYVQENKGIVEKIFKEGEINRDFKSSVLFRILEKKDVLEKINQENHKYKYVFPQKILVDHSTNEMFGYIMDWIQNAYPISSLRDKVEIQKLGLSKKDIFEIIITIGEGIEALHRAANIFIGDLNGRNILFDAQKNVYFLDFDGMGIDEVTPEFCTDGYIDPVSKKSQTITMKDDWYSFAIQAFYYLTYTHPFNGIYYEMKDGKNVLLDIPDKMERRISLLGNHGMKAPAIAESWEWMDSELKSAFLNIFEGDNRESIVPYLKIQYQKLSSIMEGENSLDKIYRINPKFIAKKLNCFDGNVTMVINPYVAICEGNENQILAILTNYNRQDKMLQENFAIQNNQELEDVLLSEDGKILFIFDKQKELRILDIDRKEVIYEENIPDAMNIVVNDRTVYFAGYSKESFVIFKRMIQPDGEVVKETVMVGKQRIKWFDVKFNSKFVMITQAPPDTDEVYCNSEYFCSIKYTSEDQAQQARYNILYDDSTKSWLVINNFGKGVVIQGSGERIVVDVAEYINDVNYANIYFEKGNIYIPSQECMYIVNVNSKVVKRMECRKIMTPESKIYDVNSNGFSVITGNILYEIRKG